MTVVSAALATDPPVGSLQTHSPVPTPCPTLTPRLPGDAPTVVLARYRDPARRPREVICRSNSGGARLVIDREQDTLDDARLVARLSADEPAENASLVCRLYLSDRARVSKPLRPRRVEDGDLDDESGADWELPPTGRQTAWPQLTDCAGLRYRIEQVIANGLAIPELRWLVSPPCGQAGPPALLSLREVIGRLEDYDPARHLSARAASVHRHDPGCSVVVMRTELARIACSRIVLNRRLRETLLEVAERDGLSMSEIAKRCGRVKRDRRGNVSGETSWLARRVGLLPEGGETRPTPWIHSDVLAVIARRGLGVSPREVELG